MNILEDLEEYSGMAKNPERLMDPGDEALDELDRLLSKEFNSEEWFTQGKNQIPLTIIWFEYPHQLSFDDS